MTDERGVMLGPWDPEDDMPPMPDEDEDESEPEEEEEQPWQCGRRPAVTETRAAWQRFGVAWDAVFGGSDVQLTDVVRIVTDDDPPHPWLFSRRASRADMTRLRTAMVEIAGGLDAEALRCLTAQLDRWIGLPAPCEIRNDWKMVAESTFKHT